MIVSFLDILTLTLPLPPSLNSCFRNVKINLRLPTKKAIDWKNQAVLIARNEIKKQNWKLSKEKTVIEILVFWADARKSDCDNRIKLFDCFNGIIWEDDHLCLYRFIDYSIDRENPRLEIRIYKKPKVESISFL